jgi:hypothetical protein
MVGVKGFASHMRILVNPWNDPAQTAQNREW